MAFGGRAAATTALNLRSIMFSSRSAYGKGLNPNSVKKVLCFSLAIEMAFSISTNSRCVAAKSISASPVNAGQDPPLSDGEDADSVLSFHARAARCIASRATDR